MRKIVVTNLKGGSGKTTISTTLAASLAGSGLSTALLDLDPQKGATEWLERRSPETPTIQGLSIARMSQAVTRSFALRIPVGTDCLVVDTPAGLSGPHLSNVVRGASAILIPVLPSELDTRAAAKTISDLLLRSKISRDSNRIGIIANKVRQRTLAFDRLQRFLSTLDLPIIATLHDRQAYPQASYEGLGLSELRASNLSEELASWAAIIGWIGTRPLEFMAQTALGGEALPSNN